MEQKFVSFTKYYNKYSTLDILHFSAHYMHQTFHKCTYESNNIKIFNLKISIRLTPFPFHFRGISSGGEKSMISQESRNSANIFMGKRVIV